MTLNYNAIPEHLRGGMQRFVERGTPPGHFLTAILSNDLMVAVRRGDDASQAAMPVIARWLYSNAPCWCFGSPDRVDGWIARGGLAGGADAEVAA